MIDIVPSVSLVYNNIITHWFILLFCSCYNADRCFLNSAYPVVVWVAAFVAGEERDVADAEVAGTDAVRLSARNIL